MWYYKRLLFLLGVVFSEYPVSNVLFLCQPAEKVLENFYDVLLHESLETVDGKGLSELRHMLLEEVVGIFAH